MPTRSTSSIPTLYDFRRPHKFNREHVRALQIVGETFARRFASTLSTTVRTICEVSLEGVSQLTYEEYIRALPNPACMAIISLAPLPGTAALNLPVPILYEAIDHLLGGPGGSTLSDHPLTEIEMALARQIQDRALVELARSFDSIITLSPQLLHQEANPQFAQVAVSTDLIVSITFTMRIGEREGQASICIPYASMQPALEDLTGNIARAAIAVSEPAMVGQALLDGLDRVPVSVSVRFNEVALSSAEIIDLREGDVLALHHPVDEPLAVSVGGIARFAARAGRNGRRLACVVVDTTYKEHHR